MIVATTARASHRVAMRKMDSIEESSVPALMHDHTVPGATEAATLLRLQHDSVGVISLAKAVLRGTPSPVVDESIREQVGKRRRLFLDAKGLKTVAEILSALAGEMRLIPARPIYSLRG